MAVLNVPIQLNRGNSAPANNSLLEGEIYLALDTNTLYTAYNNTTNLNISGYASQLYNAADTVLFNFNRNLPICTLGGLNISYNNIESTYEFTADTNARISGIRLNNLRRTVLSTEMYGSTLPDPSTAITGQLFFKYS